MNEKTEFKLLSFMLFLFVFVAVFFIYNHISNSALGKHNNIITFLFSFIFALFFGIFYYYNEIGEIKHIETGKNNWSELKNVR